ncbi:pentapeptide repeat-containing protein [Ruegeria sp.]|uniref:pentapeptide repeat-containing protein n=1 Tax=Ruegeria sp. TaxID=1879320 RepID=UPI003C7E49D5
MSDYPDAIDRINALTNNARNTWFALLGVLVFVGLTLMRVEHIDFYGVNRATQLPLVNVEVPTRFFFVAAPILTAAVYGYFHLYLVRLWDALASADARQGGLRLGDAITPWLVTDAALLLRHRRQKDFCTTQRTLEFPSMLLNFALAWLAGLVVLFFIWWLSMSARTFWMAGIAVGSFAISLFAGMASLAMCWLRMGENKPEEHTRLWSTPVKATVVLLALGLGGFSYVRTAGPAGYLAPVDLEGQKLTERPKGWLPRSADELEYRMSWCMKQGVSCSELEVDDYTQIYNEWSIKRNALLEELPLPRISNLNSIDVFELATQDVQELETRGPDFREASFRLSFMPRVNFTGARFHNADGRGAVFEGASLSRADFENAELQAADFGGANLDFAKLRGADASGASFLGARLQGAILHSAVFRNSDFRHTRLTAAEFDGAHLNSAVFSFATLVKASFVEADLRFSRFVGSNFVDVDFSNADISFSYFADSNHADVLPRGAKFSSVVADGAAFRNINLGYIDTDTKTNFENAFLDKSVKLRSDWRNKENLPCQWILDRELSDEEFYARWLGWLHKHPDYNGSWIKWKAMVPREYWYVDAIRPDPSCKWKSAKVPGRL